MESRLCRVSVLPTEVLCRISYLGNFSIILGKLGLNGRFFEWIRDYLSGRTFQTRVQSSYSDVHSVGAGVPQGAVLSPTLFNIMLHDFPEEADVTLYTYADDITMSIVGRDLSKIRSSLQRYLNSVVTWLEGWEMVVCPDKSSMQVYARSRNIGTILKINNRVLPQVKVKKILGVIFDAPLLTYSNHILNLCGDVKRRINIMKCISSINWGASTRKFSEFFIKVSFVANLIMDA